MDLTGFKVVRLDVTTATASAEVTLPAEGDIVGTLRSNSGGLTLYTPSTRSVSFNIVSKGSGWIGVEEGVRREGGAESRFDASSGSASVSAEPLPRP